MSDKAIQGNKDLQRPGTASNLAKQLRLDSKEIQAEMMAGDYENLLQVFDKHFGSFVILYR